jgi:hypothetical protein
MVYVQKQILSWRADAEGTADELRKTLATLRDKLGAAEQAVTEGQYTEAKTATTAALRMASHADQLTKGLVDVERIVYRLATDSDLDAVAENQTTHASVAAIMSGRFAKGRKQGT